MTYYRVHSPAHPTITLKDINSAADVFLAISGLDDSREHVKARLAYYGEYTHNNTFIGEFEEAPAQDTSWYGEDRAYYVNEA